MIKSFTKKLLNKLGIEIITQRSRPFIKWSFFAQLNFKQFLSSYNSNRQALSKVDYWLNDEIFKKSLWGYGIPYKDKYVDVNETKPEVTYSDLIVFLSNYLKKKINYLEIGVSFGKNFFQMANAFKESSLYGIEIENLNPVLESKFEKVSVLFKESTKEVKDSSGKVKFYTSSFVKYKYESNEIIYLSENLFDETIWKHLQPAKFNVIFSDAWHSADAIRHETEMLLRHNLIDPDAFIMVWDDLGGEMTEEFFRITERLIKHFDLKDCDRYVTDVHGMIGYQPHPVGIFTSFKIPSTQVLFKDI